MSPLPYPDLFFLEAARGWIILGNFREARHELNRIPAQQQSHPDVLEVRFAVYSKARKWVLCMELAAAMLDLAPDRPTAWINSAQALHQLKQTQEAWNALYAVRHRFPKVAAIPYDLARYACRLGRKDASMKWLRKAFKLGGAEFKKMARSEADLKPLWDKI